MHRVMLCFACGCLGMVGNRAGAAVSDAAQDCLVAAPLSDVKMLGYAGRKTDAFLAHRVRSKFAQKYGWWEIRFPFEAEK